MVALKMKLFEKQRGLTFPGPPPPWAREEMTWQMALEVRVEPVRDSESFVRGLLKKNGGMGKGGGS